MQIKLFEKVLVQTESGGVNQTTLKLPPESGIVENQVLPYALLPVQSLISNLAEISVLSGQSDGCS